MLGARYQRELLLQILNEVCNGLRVDDFQSAFGFSKSDAKAVLLNLKDGGDIEALSKRDLASLRRSTLLTMRELEDGNFEFQTRTGFDLMEAQAMVELLDKMVAGA